MYEVHLTPTAVHDQAKCQGYIHPSRLGTYPLRATPVEGKPGTRPAPRIPGKAHVTLHAQVYAHGTVHGGHTQAQLGGSWGSPPFEVAWRPQVPVASMHPHNLRSLPRPPSPVDTTTRTLANKARLNSQETLTSLQAHNLAGVQLPHPG